MVQLELRFTSDERGLRRYLEARLRRTVHLTLTENSTRMVSASKCRGSLKVRLHRVFLQAPEEVLLEVSDFIEKRGRTPLTSRFLRERSAEIGRRKREAQGRTRGAHFDLKEVFDSVNREYFGGSVASTIGWSRKAAGRVRKRTLGSYSFSTDSIRINTVLDSKRVPGYFLEFIVYHEMLHARLGVQERGGRRSVHSREFRAREKDFNLYKEAVQWEKENMGLL